jgi:hypothetical protein
MAPAPVISEIPTQITTDTPSVMSRDSEVESPSSLGYGTTPDSELSLTSEPSPEPRHEKLPPLMAPVDARAKSRAKAKELSLEEQVSQGCRPNFSRTYC